MYDIRHCSNIVITRKNGEKFLVHVTPVKTFFFLTIGVPANFVLQFMKKINSGSWQQIFRNSLLRKPRTAIHCNSIILGLLHVGRHE